MPDLDDVAREIGRDRVAGHEYRNPDALDAALNAGYTIEDLAHAFDVSQVTIARWKDKHGIETPRDCNHGDAVRKGIEESRDHLQKLHARTSP